MLNSTIVFLHIVWIVVPSSGSITVYHLAFWDKLSFYSPVSLASNSWPFHKSLSGAEVTLQWVLRTLHKSLSGAKTTVCASSPGGSWLQTPNVRGHESEWFTLYSLGQASVQLCLRPLLSPYLGIKEFEIQADLRRSLLATASHLLSKAIFILAPVICSWITGLFKWHVAKPNW